MNLKRKTAEGGRGSGGGRMGGVAGRAPQKVVVGLRSCVHASLLRYLKDEADCVGASGSAAFAVC